jgi:lysine biosynthesis protein LysW
MWEPSVELHDACPACGEMVRVDEDVVLGETVLCEHCGVELEVIGLGPVRLDLYEEEEK